MRVLFDGFWWDSGPTSNAEVMREFIWAWAAEFPNDVMHVAVPARDSEMVRSRLPVGVELVRTRLRPQGISAIVELPLIARRLETDVTIVHNFTPLVGKSAVFVHDLIFMTNPEWFTEIEKVYFALIPLTLKRARWVMTSTRTESRRISRLIGRGQVEAVGLGLSRALLEAHARRPGGLDGVHEFTLTVGRLNARKNLGATIEGAIASGMVTPRTPLVIVGEPSGRAAELPLASAAAVRAGSVRFLGFVHADELAWLYQHARVFVFLSLDEGFGMPLLEAAAFGTPIVASDIDVFREVLGEKARYTSPLDIAEIAAAIRSSTLEDRPESVHPAVIGYDWRESVKRMRRFIEAG